MDIIVNYLKKISGPNAQVEFDKLVEAKRNVLIPFLASEFEDKELDCGTLKTSLKRVFSSAAKRYTDKKFIFNSVLVDWNGIVADILKMQADQAKQKVEMLNNKRIKLHAKAHLDADREITDIIEASLSRPHDQIDDLFLDTSAQFKLGDIEIAKNKWLESYSHPKEIHKQDILYYNIFDMVSNDYTKGTSLVLDDKYILFLQHCSSVSQMSAHDTQITEQDTNDTKEYARVVLSKKHTFKTLIKRAKENRRKAGNKNKRQKYCLRVFSLFRSMFKNNMLAGDGFNEYEYTMAFIYPLFTYLFKYDKGTALRWGETKLYCKKREENAALDDNDRRSPGPSIDMVMNMPHHNHLEFCLGEISGPPSKQDHEHYLGDRVKCAKNMKSMIKAIINLKASGSAVPKKLKVIGIHIYNLTIHVYSLIRYDTSIYIFRREMSFDIPTLKKTYKDHLPIFIENMIELHHVITQSKNTIIEYLDERQDVIGGSNTSSPYVSPKKRKHN